MESVRTMLVDDNPEFLEAAIRFLSSSPHIQVIGSTLSAEDALTQIKTLNPDLVILDFAMPNMSGIEATRIIKNKTNPPRVIILTLHDNPEYRKASEAALADGFVTKSNFGMELLPLIDNLFQIEQPVIETNPL
jgi:DNA-binding NarL/FixJ family response regulator